MEVDSETKAETELLLEGGEDDGNAEFTSGDVELLLGDDDVNAFANETYEAPSEEAAKEQESAEEKTDKTGETSKHISSHYNRGNGRGRPFHHRGRGYGPPPPGYFPPRGLRPPFPGAVPRFGRHPPPFAFRGRPPMGFMRYPRGMYRPMRPHYHEEEEEDESMTEEKKEGEEEEEGGEGGPKSLMSIRIGKDIKECVKTQILSKTPHLMAPLGMGMGPRYHLRGVRPPHGPPPPGPIPPPPAGAPHPGGPPPPPSRGPRGSLPPERSHEHHHHRPLKRSLSSSHSEGPRAKMMVPPPPISSSSSSGSRSNLRHIQTVDEPMHHRHQHPPPQHSSYQRPQHHYPPSNPRPSFTVSHKPAPSLTTIQTVDHGGGQSYSGKSGNLRTIPTLGGASVPTPMRITNAGGSSSRVLISNLPPNMSFERISAMTTACGNVRTINVKENGTAVVEFANVNSAENFIRVNNHKTIDRSKITVARLA